MSAPSTVTPPSDFEVAQEDDTIASRKVGVVLVAGVVATIAAVAIAGWILASTTNSLPARMAVSAPVAPRQIAGIHQTLIERDRHGWEQREEQRRSLDEYRWISRERGIAQIPIDRAMQIVLDDEARAKGAP